MQGPMETGAPVAGRSCGRCTLCCDLLEVRSLEKPRNQMCSSCQADIGCAIYDQRPEDCDAFQCGFRLMGDLDDAWRPSRCGFLIHYEADARRLVIHCDLSREDAWRQQPFHARLREWSRSVMDAGGMMIVWTGQQATLIFPDEDRDLGHVRDDQWFLPVERGDGDNRWRDFEVVEPDDPRLPPQ